MPQHNSPNTTSLIPLADRSLLAITGLDARAFLQGMVTCNIDHLSQTQALYGAHLTPQGRMVEPFFVYFYEGKIVLDCAKSRLMPLAKTLHGYKMRFDIEFEDLTEDLAVFADITPTTALAGTCQKFENGLQVTDPRLPEMGHRYLLPVDTKAEAELQAYHNHRIKLGLPESADFLPGKTISGEFCLEYQNGVDYKKGCYIGQEMTARTHFRSPPKKRVIALQYAGPAPAFGAELYAGNLKIGHVFSCANGHGIAIARTEKAFAAGTALTAGGIALTAEKPQWADYAVESQ